MGKNRTLILAAVALVAILLLTFAGFNGGGDVELPGDPPAEATEN